MFNIFNNNSLMFIAGIGMVVSMSFSIFCILILFIADLKGVTVSDEQKFKLIDHAKMTSYLVPVFGIPFILYFIFN